LENENVNNIIKLYFHSFDVFRKLEVTPRDFGSGDLLYQSEVHTLEVIGYNPGINLTGIAIKMDISKSAISKFAKKLIDKKLIHKSSEQNNKKEVLFFLTPKGNTVFEGHQTFEKNTFSGVYNLFDELTETEKAFLKKFFMELINRINIHDC